MAIVTNESVVESASSSKQKKADGWLNLRITDAQGIEHSIQAVIPLYKENRVHRALMNKGGDLTLVGSVKVVDANAPEIEQ